jgi:hypothetical protein
MAQREHNAAHSADAEREAVWWVWRERNDDIDRLLDDPRVRKRIAVLITQAILNADKRERRRLGQ